MIFEFPWIFNIYEGVDKEKPLTAVIRGKTGKSSTIELPQSNPPTALLKGNKTYKTNSVILPIAFDQTVVKGGYSIDGALKQEADEQLSESSITEFTNKKELTINAELSDGSHTITVWGENQNGDSFHYSELFTVDTMPPKLVLTYPLNGSLFEADGTLSIKGLGDSDAAYSLLVDGVKTPLTPVTTRMEQPTESINFTANIGSGTAAKKVEIVATDAAGNKTTRTAKVQSRALSQLFDTENNKLLRSLAVSSGSLSFEGNNIPLSLTGETKYTLNLAATQPVAKQRTARSASDTMIIKDPQLVSWNIFTTQGSATIDNNGSFVAQPGSTGFVEATLNLGGSNVKASATFGAEVFSQTFALKVCTTTGGRLVADPSGQKNSGQVISLAAIANSGYQFDGWQSDNGGSFAEAKSTTTDFTMPANEVTVTAVFSSIGGNGGGGNGGGNNGSGNGGNDGNSGNTDNNSSGTDSSSNSIGGNSSNAGGNNVSRPTSVSASSAPASTSSSAETDEQTQATPTQPGVPLAPEQTTEYWNAAIGLLDRAAAGETISMELAGISKLPASYLQKLYGMDVTVLLKMDGGYIWRIYGKDIPATTDFTLDVVLTVTMEDHSIFKKMTGTDPILALSVDQSITIPMTLLWELDSKYEGTPLFLYRYQKDSKTAIFASTITIANGIAEIPISEGCSYALSTEQIDENFNAQATWIFVAAAVILAIVLLGGLLLIGFKKGWLQAVLTRLKK